MTVIAWDGKTLAADRMAGDNWLTCNQTLKIYRIGGCLVGCAGASAKLREMLAWFRAGAQPADFPQSARDSDNVDMLVITPDRGIHLYQNTPFPIEFSQTQFAIGSGKEVARAVMMLGHDAAKAVELACAVCAGCGNGIDTLGLE